MMKIPNEMDSLDQILGISTLCEQCKTLMINMTLEWLKWAGIRNIKEVYQCPNEKCRRVQIVRK